MRPRPKFRTPHSPLRTQQTSPELIAACLDFLQRKFYPAHPIPFSKDRPRLLAWVVLWPARWFNKRGVTIPATRYREIFMTVFLDAIAHGHQSKVDYPPAYLAHIIQTHFQHHGEEYYEEAKRHRENLSENALLKSILAGQLQPSAAQADPIREMANAARLLAPKKKPQKAPVNDQLTML